MIGYFLILLVGVSLSLMGGGGSILAVPILVYFFGVSAVNATAYSLFIVGIASGVGAYKKWQKNLIDFKVGTAFFIPGTLGVFGSRYWIIPHLPEEIFRWESYVVSKELLIMLVFAITMILASLSMIRGRKDLEGESEETELNLFFILIQGLLTGLLTGFVGAGGGFLIIPALVVFAKLPMKKAVGTSLFIISMNSLLGFMGDVMSNPEIQWVFLLTLVALSIVGIFIGSIFSQKVPEKTLKKAFGYFVLIMGSFILLQQIYG
jgi:uncharacterized membrane protein YfcA